MVDDMNTFRNEEFHMWNLQNVSFCTLKYQIRKANGEKDEQLITYGCAKHESAYKWYFEIVLENIRMDVAFRLVAHRTFCLWR